MATYCSNCNKKKNVFSGAIEPWYKCIKCGPICNKCDEGSALKAALGGNKKCPKCSGNLKPMK